jgi:hypothetical protein
MNKVTAKRKLVLNKTTLRSLTDVELRRVNGGAPSQDAGPGVCDGVTNDCPSDGLLCQIKSFLRAC